MIGNESWMYQGRQSHGWFGHGTSPHNADPPGSDSIGSIAERIHGLGHTLVVGLPRSKRYHDAARLDPDDHARLERLLTATVHALPLGTPAIARSVFGVHPDAPGIDDVVRAARLVRDAHGFTDLRAAADAMGRAAQQVGLDRFKRFLRNADDHLDRQGGLLTFVRDIPGGVPLAGTIPTEPLIGRLPWGPLVGGSIFMVAPILRDMAQREDVRDTMRRFDLDPSKPADIVAAYAFLWAEFKGPWRLDTPQTGPEMLAMVERVMRFARANPDLFLHASADDPDALRVLSSAVKGAAPGSGIETRTDEERALVESLAGQGKNSAEIQAALDLLRACGMGNTATERRNSRGTAVISVPLRRIESLWLNPRDGDTGVPIPGQVAAELKGKQFRNFGAFREAFWQTVAGVRELARQFAEENLVRMRSGKAPFILRPVAEELSRTWILHHDPAIGQGGAVYDMSKMVVITPTGHAAQHYGRN